MQNGSYARMVARDGAPWEIAARAFGFPVAAITITGQSRLTEQEVLAATGVTTKNSLPFVDVEAVRERLLAVPLVKSAQVMKLYPDRLVVAIEERQPHALWQRDGAVVVVSQDGVPIDNVSDERYLSLPFVVGDGAQKRMAEFSALMQDMGDLSRRVKAGVLVASRRWNIQMTNGVTVKLPETDPGAAVATLTRPQREARILDKDILSIDLRAGDRVAVRLTAEAAAARDATASITKSHKSGG
ncbi:MAG: FtsQ-type POTRA domain-containing protein [Methylocystis sp.]|nr:FtsQ-type POTRA domain-containing protein [Methylocystis sp.]